jgi:hypothetical protein
MLWLRKGIVHVLAVLLLVVLLGSAVATGLKIDFAHPTKLEAWLAESHLYNQLASDTLNKAQASSEQDGSNGSVSLNSSSVQQVANQVFPPQLLQQDVATFLNSNYAWLQGKTAAPSFTIDLTTQKQDFGSRIGQLVQSHLAAVPACTATQLSQLQIPVNPLTVACRPGTLDPATEGTSVAQAIDTSDFLKNTDLTAQSISSSTNSNSKPYYKVVSKAPQLYRLALQLPWICAGLALLLTLGIVFIAPTRRKGLRRTGIIFLEAGIILIVVKFVADTIVKHIESKTFTQTFTGQLQQPYDNLLHRIETSLVQVDLYFGVAFVVIGVGLLGYLLVSRQRSARTAQVPRQMAAPQPINGDNNAVKAPGDVQLAPQPQRQPSTDFMASQPRPVGTPPAVSTAPPPAPKPPRPRRPRLIQ